MKIVRTILFVFVCTLYAGLPDQADTASILFNPEMIPDDELIDDVASMSLLVAGAAFIAYMAEADESSDSEQPTESHDAQDQSSTCTIL